MLRKILAIILLFTLATFTFPMEKIRIPIVEYEEEHYLNEDNVVNGIYLGELNYITENNIIYSNIGEYSIPNEDIYYFEQDEIEIEKILKIKSISKSTFYRRQTEAVQKNINNICKQNNFLAYYVEGELSKEITESQFLNSIKMKKDGFIIEYITNFYSDYNLKPVNNDCFISIKLNGVRKKWFKYVGPRGGRYQGRYDKWIIKNCSYETITNIPVNGIMFAYNYLDGKEDIFKPAMGRDFIIPVRSDYSNKIITLRVSNRKSYIDVYNNYISEENLVFTITYLEFKEFVEKLKEVDFNKEKNRYIKEEESIINDIQSLEKEIRSIIIFDKIEKYNLEN